MNNEVLLKDIENLRKKMIAVGLAKGIASEETIKLSKKLDNLIKLKMKIQILRMPTSSQSPFTGNSVPLVE